jgi:hypothetical protein
MEKLYSSELADQILGRLAGGESLRAICRGRGMPKEVTVRLWVLEDREGFAERFERARMLGCYAIADECLEIADDGRNDFNEQNGKGDRENVQRSRLRMETRKWLLSKLAPRVFGDRIEHTGPGGGPLPVPVFNVAFVAAPAIGSVAAVPLTIENDCSTDEHTEP